MENKVWTGDYNCMLRQVQELNTCLFGLVYICVLSNYVAAYLFTHWLLYLLIYLFFTYLLLGGMLSHIQMVTDMTVCASTYPLFIYLPI